MTHRTRTVGWIVVLALYAGAAAAAVNGITRKEFDGWSYLGLCAVSVAAALTVSLVVLRQAGRLRALMFSIAAAQADHGGGEDHPSSGDLGQL